MIVEWLIYALVVSALVSVAAWLAERGAAAQRWPTRWVWVGGMAMSVAGPLLAWLLPAAPPATPFVGAPGAYLLESLPALTTGSGSPVGPSLEMLILMGWAGVSTLILAAVAVLAARLGLRLRGWPRRVVDGVEVRVSRRTGPAAMGLIRAIVVVPEWALALEPTQRRLLVLHEAEHVRARDPQLALVGLLLCVMAPWNIPLWWQLKRLRVAIEMDCDGRVLRRAPYRSSYGSLLVAVGQRKAHLAIGLAESPSMLERRIRMITKKQTTRATLRALGLAAVSSLVLAVACETPGPTGATAVEQEQLRLEGTQAALEQMECAPAVYRNGTRSTLEDLDQVDIETIHVFKGPRTKEVREDGESCGVILVLTKDATVEEANTARGLLERLSTERPGRAGVEAGRQQARTVEQVQDTPTFTPMTVAPRLRSHRAIPPMLEAAYPPLLRDAGIGGTVNVWFFIDETGRVAKVQINESSGYQALDEAALAVARQMEFQPALNKEEPVAVWVALDIKFEVQ